MEGTKTRTTITRKTVEKMNWKEIVQGIRNGKLNLSVGDTITDVLEDGCEFTVEVAAISPYDESTVALVFKDIAEYHIMNEEWTNKGGWRGSNLRKWLNEEFIELLPDDLREVIKERTITQEKNGERLVSTDKLWLLSETEVFGDDYTSDIGDVQFELYKNAKNRVKMDAGSSAWWWLRSPYYGNNNLFCNVNSNGNRINYYADISGGVAPAFII